MFAFGDNHVIIPIYVIDEIDNFKKDLSDLGRNARQVARELDDLRQNGCLSQPVKTEHGGTLSVALGHRSPLNSPSDSRKMDNLILEVALEVRDKNPDILTTLVTKDVNMRVRGDALGLVTTDYDEANVPIQELYAGSSELEISASMIEEFYSEGSLHLEDDEELSANQYLLLRNHENPGQTALARFDGDNSCAVPVRKLREGVWGIRPRNKEQHYALDLLLNDDIKLVTLVGKAGTGKTLLALAAGLQKCLEEQDFHKLLVSRPIFPLGRDIGFLPGDINEKLNPWMQPIYDNIELLLGLNQGDKKNGRSYAELFDMGYVNIEPLTYIRGRSLPSVYMVVDEAQNLTPHEVKTIITRAGEGTKIVLTGDPYQIDNPYIDASNNGLTTLVEKFRSQGLAGHVTLEKGERSKLAELATQVL
jgi:PhoH-like ATPase